jgi:hypothetical protein
MKKSIILALSLACAYAVCAGQAADLKQSKLTQVVKDVKIISAASQKEQAAAVNDIFSMPDILSTGDASRAELVAGDETVTRVGANTIFSFDPARRSIDLKQGSLLFHAPHGKGGGTIRTGAATASVLGTTLIVTTTTNGGFKVLALEGKVEIRFLNGLKQKLLPGQMTYILPGGDKMAPVLVFRLDELTENSLLVKGFDQPLESLPLIRREIERQLKLIRSGRATDTGLYAGDNAGPNMVQVLDLNTLSIRGQELHPKPSPHPTPDPTPTPKPGPTPEPDPEPVPTDLQKAMAADATINQPSLTDASIPTPPNHVFTASSFALSGNSYFSGEHFTGFIARNILVNSDDLEMLSINLSPYSGMNRFDMVAVKDFTFAGSASFYFAEPMGETSQGTGLASLSLIAGNRFILAPGISLNVHVTTFRIASPAELTLDSVSVMNYANAIALDSAAGISLQNESLLYGGGRVGLTSGGGISVMGSSIVGGYATLAASKGGIQFENATLSAQTDAAFTAGGAMNFNNSTLSADTLRVTGSGTATINTINSVFQAAQTVLLSAPGEVSINGAGTDGEPVTEGSALSATSVTVRSDKGNVGMRDTSVAAQFLTLNSGDGILLDSGGRRFTASGEVSRASFTAPNLITVNNTDLSAFSVVNMAANTINLYNVAFGGTVNLRSQLGTWHNGTILPGAVNNLGGVTYNGSPVQAPDGHTGQIPYTGITVGTLSGRTP